MANCNRRNDTSRVPPRPERGATPHSPPEAMNVRGEAIRLLRLSQVLNLTGLGKTKIYELQAAGDFPMRVQITAHAVGWVEAEVQAWLAHRVALSTSLPAAGSVGRWLGQPSRAAS